MAQIPSLVMSIARPAIQVEREQAEKMLIIVKSHYHPLLKEIDKVFSGQRGVRILVDRRMGERRKAEQPVSSERRISDRRKHEEELLKVILPI
jgi:hypothetical protein